MLHAQQREDIQMLASLRHHSVVRGHDQDYRVHAAGPGHHGLDEVLVARHVDDAEPLFAQVIQARPIPQTHILVGRMYQAFDEPERAEAELWEAKRQLTELELGKTNLSDTVARLSANRDALGVRMESTKRDIDALANRLSHLSRGEDELGEPKFVAPGVIADDDRRYLFHKYKFKQGNGLALANRRAADMVHRYLYDA